MSYVVCQRRMVKAIVLITSFVSLLWGVLATRPASAEDWPEWRGKGRRGVWNETGILEKFPQNGLKVKWRTPIHGGYSGPAVAAGRVFVSDFKHTRGKRGSERVLCLDEQTGKVLWTYDNGEVDYGGVRYGTGPRATPTVDGDRVYFLGSLGDLVCLEVKTGRLIWRRHYQKEFNAKLPTWAFAAAPLVVEDRLICPVGGRPGAKVVALDKRTGKEVWRALRGGIGYSAPIVIKAGGVDQLIQWHQRGVSSLNPRTGQVHWEQRMRARIPVATPVHVGNLLFVTDFYCGPMMLRLAEDKPDATMLWRGKSRSERKTDGIHSIMMTPAIWKDHVYGVDSYGQFRCLEAKTGKRIWETLKVTREKARWASAFMVRNDDRFFINNDRGELIIARLSPAGYEEIDRTSLIKPTTRGGGKRELRFLNWTLPAYANRHIVVRNDREIIRVSLEKP